MKGKRGVEEDEKIRTRRVSKKKISTSLFPFKMPKTAAELALEKKFAELRAKKARKAAAAAGGAGGGAAEAGGGP